MAYIDFDRVPPFYHKYLQQVAQYSLEAALQHYAIELSSLLEAIPESRWNYRYAPGKWSIKEVVQHITDTERIFAYRALCFARGEKQSLPGFDENEYAQNASADYRSKQSLLDEFAAVHRSTRFLFDSFTQQQLETSGVANGNLVYVAGIGFTIAGHALHHLQILKERYLQPETV
ncbi:DinB superfamily protein [Cnuella takakiae]|uniref:DinB superfamily protein n=1 Tax=Cnuella takakiae TaxID=1302690 RepID=A0A1M4VRE0_9BACT|nr:DinB family protein [Cnuella takakiae]OLY92526.1 hypothetical protein BUE76_11970 [Cnuella takakiae]SHE71403.1 DinB superfamily protein [Cnuella takakiae]